MVLVLIAIITLLQRFKGLKKNEGIKEKEIRKLSNFQIIFYFKICTHSLLFMSLIYKKKCKKFHISSNSVKIM